MLFWPSGLSITNVWWDMAGSFQARLGVIQKCVWSATSHLRIKSSTCINHPDNDKLLDATQWSKHGLWVLFLSFFGKKYWFVSLGLIETSSIPWRRVAWAIYAAIPAQSSHCTQRLDELTDGLQLSAYKELRVYAWLHAVADESFTERGLHEGSLRRKTVGNTEGGPIMRIQQVRFHYSSWSALETSNETIFFTCALHIL